MGEIGRWLCDHNHHAWRVASISDTRTMSSMIGHLSEPVYRRLDVCQRGCGASRHDQHAVATLRPVRVLRGSPHADREDRA
jgi:hypothetical protein